MDKFHLAVNFNTNEPMEIDEVECIVANLIYRKYIKGYIAKRTTSAIKVDKETPFPPLSKIFPQETL